MAPPESFCSLTLPMWGAMWPKNMSHVDRINPEARSHYEELRVLAECTDSAEVISGYLWTPARPEIHFGALCVSGVNLLWGPPEEWVESERLHAAAVAVREAKELPQGSRTPFLCPECLRRSQRLLDRVYGTEDARSYEVGGSSAIVCFSAVSGRGRLRQGSQRAPADISVLRLAK